MSDKRVPLLSRRSFLKDSKPKLSVARSHSIAKQCGMNWSAAPPGMVSPPTPPPISPLLAPPPGSKLPPGYVIPDGLPPLPKPPEPRPKSSGEYPARLSLKLDPEDRETDLARLCSDQLHELPQLVKVREKFSVPGSDLKLEKGESLLLLFIAELPRVHAVDTTDGSEVWMPINADQLYERLPLDPRLDDKLFMGVRKLMSAQPMPSVVRVLEGYGSDDYTECVDIEDIIRLSHVEEKSPRHSGKVFIAQNQIGHRLELHTAMECAHFTTMLSSLFMYMSQLVDLEFPQRVRVVGDTVFERRKPKEEKVLRLLSFKSDFQVIAARAKEPRLLSIPVTVPLSVQTAQFEERRFQDCLPALYPSVNVSWGLREFGRPELSTEFKEIPQPLPEPLSAWLGSFEGKERVCEVAKVSKEDLVRDLKELTNYNKELADRIAFLSQSERPFIPNRDKLKAPPRPVKPKPIAPKPIVPTSKTPPAKVPPKPKPRLTQTSDSPKTEKKAISKFKPTIRSQVDDGYEVPQIMPIGVASDDDDDGDYEEMPDISSSPKHPGASDKTSFELKNILQLKEKTITQLKNENQELKQKCKNLEKEKESIKKSGFAHVQEIHRLQGEIDKLVSRHDEGIYDLIGPTERPLPILPKSSNNSVIYNTPDSMLAEKTLMARTDVEGVADILRHLGLGRYVDKFHEEEVDGALLVSLDETVLKEDLGMTGLHARKLLLDIKKNK